MGREIRMVPPNWQHPEYWANGMRGSEKRFQPMFDEDYEKASAKWIEAFIKWHVEKKYPDYADEENKAMPYWDWAGTPPDKAYYRPWKDEEATWFQLWETVSEGTPVSPPFATKDELIQYLADHGDTWDQHRGNAPWGLERAKAFCEDGWCPSFAMINGKIVNGTAIAPEDKRP